MKPEFGIELVQTPLRQFIAHKGSTLFDTFCDVLKEWKKSRWKHVLKGVEGLMITPVAEATRDIWHEVTYQTPRGGAYKGGDRIDIAVPSARVLISLIHDYGDDAIVLPRFVLDIYGDERYMQDLYTGLSTEDKWNDKGLHGLVHNLANSVNFAICETMRKEAQDA